MSYLARRFSFYLVTAWAAITMNFFIPRLMPGNPAQILVSRLSAQGPIAPGLYHALQVAFGLNTNSSLLTQYFQYWDQLFHGNLGTSITDYPASVASVIAAALPWTIGLIGMSTIIAVVLGTVIGTVAASADPRDPRWWLAKGDSPAIYLAARAVAARLRVTTAPVLLAAYAVATARVMGSNPVLAQVIVSNRFRPSLANTVSTVAQAGLIAIDVAGVTFDVAVGRALRASVTASKNAYYDPDRLHERVAEISEQRGEEMDTGCFFNDTRMRLSTEAIGSAPTPGQLRAVLGRTSLYWDEPLTGLPARLERAAGYENFFLNLTDGEDPAAETVGFLIAQDTHYISMADTEACVQGIESILVSAAFDPAVPTGV